jgi:nucleolar protein 16
LSQNYRRLGLISKLNKRAGGEQKNINTESHLSQTAHQAFAILPGTTHTQKAIEEVELEHDIETGAIKIRQDASKAVVNPLNDPLNELEDPTELSLSHSMGHVKRIGNGFGITETLEELASSGMSKRPRQQSEREREWVARLVEKHGADYAAMFRDRTLNPMQQSVGDIRKRVMKWQTSHTSIQSV